MRNDPAPPPGPAVPPDRSDRRSAGAHVAAHARRLSRLQVGLLLGFLVLGVIGAATYATAYVHHPATPSSPNTSGTPAGASGFLGTPSSAGDTPTGPTAGTAEGDSWSAWGGQHGAALGFGFVGGFVIGFIFRAFLKLMALVTIVIGGGLAALSYFHILNVDMTAARQAYDTNAGWITDQATRLKDVLVAHLPSSGGGAAGVFFGLRRR